MQTGRMERGEETMFESHGSPKVMIPMTVGAIHSVTSSHSLVKRIQYGTNPVMIPLVNFHQ